MPSSSEQPPKGVDLTGNQIFLLSSPKSMITAPEQDLHQASPFTPKEQDRLRAFQTLNSRINEFGPKLENREDPWVLFVLDGDHKHVVDDKGNKIVVPITQQSVEGWKRSAASLYQDFRVNPRMIAEADKILQAQREQAGEELRKLNTIFEAGDSEPF